MIYLLQASHLPNLQHKCTLKPRMLDVVPKSVHEKLVWGRQLLLLAADLRILRSAAKFVSQNEWQVIHSFSAESNLLMRKTPTSHKAALSVPEGHLYRQMRCVTKNTASQRKRCRWPHVLCKGLVILGDFLNSKHPCPVNLQDMWRGTGYEAQSMLWAFLGEATSDFSCWSQLLVMVKQSRGYKFFKNVAETDLQCYTSW